MEVRIYECPPTNKAKVQEILEAEPYELVSFSRQGYKFKEGKILGLEGDNIYLKISSDEKFFAFAEGKLGDLVKRLSNEKYEQVLKAFENEESSAEMGMGAIFG